MLLKFIELVKIKWKLEARGIYRFICSCQCKKQGNFIVKKPHIYQFQWFRRVAESLEHQSKIPVKNTDLITGFSIQPSFKKCNTRRWAPGMTSSNPTWQVELAIWQNLTVEKKTTISNNSCRNIKTSIVEQWNGAMCVTPYESGNIHYVCIIHYLVDNACALWIDATIAGGCPLASKLGLSAGRHTASTILVVH